MAGRLNHWVAALALALATAAVFAGSLFNGFVYDDGDYVLNNPAVADPDFPWWRAFTTPYPADHPEQKLYRPLVTLSYRLDTAIWGTPGQSTGAAAGFHLTNLLWHAATVVVLVLLAGRLAAARQEARPPPDAEKSPAAGTVSLAVLAGAAWFAWHPLTTESVAWVVGRAELMAACCGLVSLLAYVRARDRGERLGAWTVLAWAAYAAALLGKENAVMVPALAALVQWRYRPGGGGWRRWAIPFAGYALLTAGYLGWRHWLFAGVALQEAAYTGIAATPVRLLVAGKVLARYFLLAVAPYRQSVFHDVRVELALSGLAAAALVGITVWLVLRRRRFPNLLFGWAWFLVALLPVANLLFPIGTVMAERFLYLPLAGLALALGSALPAGRSWPRWLAVLVAAVLVHHAVKTAVRGRQWRDDATLWASAARVYPASFAVHAQLGFAQLAAGEADAARASFQRALDLLGRQPAAYRSKLAPRIEAALEQAASRTAPKGPPAQLAAIHERARLGQLAEAAGQYAAYLAHHPEDTAAGRALADCLLHLRRFDEAAALLESLAARDPQNGLLQGKLGLAYSNLGRPDRARRAYARAVELDPQNAVTWANYGALELQAENYAQARTCFARAVALQPAAAEFHLNLAVCEWRLGRVADARAAALKVLELRPEHPEAQKLLGLLAAERPAR